MRRPPRGQKNILRPTPLVLALRNGGAGLISNWVVGAEIDGNKIIVWLSVDPQTTPHLLAKTLEFEGKTYTLTYRKRGPVG